MAMADIVILGAGVSGLAVAEWLRDDHNVQVLEAGPTPGGKVSSEQVDGFTFDRAANGWLNNEYLDPVPLDKINDPHRYLAHFPVFKANDPSKVRPVMDAKSKAHGKALNDAIEQGPNLMQDIRTVLQRFRRHSHAICGDVKDMFLRIGIPAADAPFFRVLWRNNDGNLQLSIVGDSAKIMLGISADEKVVVKW